MLGRYEEAVATADEGIAVAEEAGVSRTAGALLRSNKAEALLRSGRWAEALAAAAPEREAAGTFTASLLLLRIELNALTGRTAPAHADLREVRQHLRSTTAPQFALPLATVEAELARAEGRLDEARASVDRALARTTPGEEPRYRWPLLSLGARIEAERAIHASDEGGSVPEDAIQQAASHQWRDEGLSDHSPLVAQIGWSSEEPG
jgi:tetratricopeptide (TPR) repeat protein